MTKTCTFKLPVVKVLPTEVSMFYQDSSISITGSKRTEKIDMLFDELDKLITENSSVLLYKEDVKRLADQLSGKSVTSKEVFQMIKQRIRSKYEVLKLNFDPRTLQFNGLKTAFIIHKHIIW